MPLLEKFPDLVNDVTTGCTCVAFSDKGWFLITSKARKFDDCCSFFIRILWNFCRICLIKIAQSNERSRLEKNVFLTATLFPGSLFALFLLFNIFLAFSGSSGAVPFLDVFLVMLLWCGISVPLVFLGSYFGYRSKPIEFPTVTSKTPRPIPVQKLLGKPVIGMTCAGMVPFAAAYVELFFIMTSLWMDQYYYVFGFTLLVYFILLITCAEMAILLCYYQLCAEDYRWWWYSFFVSGSTSIWLFLYSILWFQHLEPSKLIMT